MSEVNKLVREAVDALNAMSPVDRAIHLAHQRHSFVRGQLGTEPTPAADMILAVEVERLRTALRAAQAREQRLLSALTPSMETKAAYMGEFKFPFCIRDEFGDDMKFTPNVPWTTIKEIMAAIRAQALQETANAPD